MTERPENAVCRKPFCGGGPHNLYFCDKIFDFYPSSSMIRQLANSDNCLLMDVSDGST